MDNKKFKNYLKTEGVDESSINKKELMNLL